MSCPFCMSKILKPGLELYSTPCGHVYHEMCLRGWVSKNQSCPTCRKPVQDNSLIHLFLDTEKNSEKDSDKESLLLAKIKSIVEESNSANVVLLQEAFGNSKAQLDAAEDRYQALKHGNNELKEKVKKLEEILEAGGSSNKNPAGVQDQIKAKDTIIQGLKKEINDLKTQRAEVSKEMVSFKDQIEQLNAKTKGEVRPLREVNGQVKHSLTLKFDEFSDKLTIE